MTERVALIEIEGLSPVERSAWAAVCAEALLRLYSPRFHQLFDPEAAFEIAWQFIGSGESRPAEVSAYLRKCSRARRREEAYAYGMPNGMLASLAASTLDPLGISAIECVDYCARLYSNVICFRRGVDDRDADFPGEVVEAHIEHYRAFSREVLAGVALGGDLQRGDCSRRFRLDDCATIPFASAAAPGVPAAEFAGQQTE